MTELPDMGDQQEEVERDTHALVQQYVEEIRERSLIPFFEPLRSWNTSAVRWFVGTSLALCLLIFEAQHLLRPISSRAPLPTAAVLAIEAEGTCARRQADIVQAVASYRRHHGHPPEQLSLLAPLYFQGRAVDPVSQRPYEYTTEGGVIAVACPNPSRHSLAGAAAGAGRAADR